MANMTLKVGGSKTEFPLDNGNRVWLSPNDLSILSRYDECMRDFSDMKDDHARLQALSEVEPVSDEGEAENDQGEYLSSQEADALFTDAVSALKSLEAKMRAKIDYLFDSDVADACAGNASVFSIEGGQYRFEVIIAGLLAAYEANIRKEAASMKHRMDKAVPAKYRKRRV